VPTLGLQLEEYASGTFNEPWFDLAFSDAEQLTRDDKAEILQRAFQVNHDRLLSRWPRFLELYEWSRQAGVAQAVLTFTPRDWRDLQLFSQLAWMDEEWIARDATINRLSAKGKDFTEKDKTALKQKQLEFLKLVLPIYREAAARGQIEISTTPFYHPILPLICDSDIARLANPATPLPRRAYRHPEDAREQLRRAREYHERVFGVAPVGLWPSEGSVSDQALTIAAEQGFRWFGTDEGVLGRTLNVSFSRDGTGLAANADRLYQPWRVQMGSTGITGLFRDHHISDLIGFVYSRMDAKAGAADLHARLRAIGERVSGRQPLTLCLFLDGENAWEYYPGNGREFLRAFYGHIEGDSDFRALTASEAIVAAGDIPQMPGIFPASWINANFDVWIGHSEDVQAWDLLWDTREAYARAEEAAAQGRTDAPSQTALAAAKESLLAAEGSDWCWWFGPEHSTANDAEFDALYRKHLTEVYRAIGKIAPDELAKPIKRRPERALHLPPSEYLRVEVNGRDSSYFEWLGAGLYSPERRNGAMHGRTFYLRELRYGFEPNRLCIRLDSFPGVLTELQDAEFRVTVQANSEVTLMAKLSREKMVEYAVEQERICLLNPGGSAEAAYERTLELAISKELFDLRGASRLRIGVALWHGGLPVDVLPAEGVLEVQLGEENFAWPIEPIAP
jgi:alpha-amylase/alpha-mannosidase (GH57 family)